MRHVRLPARIPIPEAQGRLQCHGFMNMKDAVVGAGHFGAREGRERQRKEERHGEGSEFGAEERLHGGKISADARCTINAVAEICEGVI